MQNPLLDREGSPGWVTVRPRGPVLQTLPALLVEPRDPAVGALTGHPELLGHVRDRTAIAANTLDKQATTTKVQTGISVRHEDLRLGEDETSPPHPEVFA
jgi:hypothetical protein